MKKIAGMILVLSMLACMLFALPTGVSAAEKVSGNGIEVTVFTDKAEYDADDDISVKVTVENIDIEKVEGAEISTVLSDALKIKSGELSAKDVSIEPGQIYTATAVVGYGEDDGGFLGLPIPLWIIIAAAAAIVVSIIILVIILAVKHKKEAASALSILLCIIMAASAFPVSVLAADTETATVVADKKIKVDGFEYSIVTTVTLDAKISTDVKSVPVDVAALFGIDPNEKDADGDGLSSYNEIYRIGTDPAKKDTDGNGVTDDEEDADGDGITNADEITLGTEPACADTDGDGLSDSEEIDETKTEPRMYDTDGDGLSDGEELELGLDPLKAKTDGKTADGNRVIEQSLGENNIDAVLTDAENDAIPSLRIKTNGSINNLVAISATTSNDFSDSRAVVGEPIDIYGEDFTKGTLEFTLKSADEGSAPTYSVLGFNANLICKYNDDGTVEYLETEYDEERNTVSAEVDGTGTYYVLDVEKLFDELGLDLPEDASSAYSLRSSARTAAVTSRASAGAMAQADIVFVIDTTGSMGDEISNVKENVEYFIDALKEKGVSAGLALVDYQDIKADGEDSTRVHKNGRSNWFYNMDDYKSAIAALSLGSGGDEPESAVDALETARLLDMRPSAGKIFILITDASYKDENRYGISNMSEEIELLVKTGVTCAVVSPSSYKETYYDLYTETDGIWADINGDFYTELMALADKIGTDIVGDGHWIYLDGPVPIPTRLDEEPKRGSKTDTDGDRIPDVEELESLRPVDGIDLDKLITKVSKGAITGTDYGTVSVYKYKSNPAARDTDFDGIDDKKDDLPKINTFTAKLAMSETTPTISYTIDYRDFFADNTRFNRDLAQASIVMSAVMYGNGTMDYDDRSGLSDSYLKDTIVGYHFDNVVDYKLDSGYDKDELKLDKYTDDDISEVIFGHKKIEYNGEEKEIIAVFVRGTNGTIEEWSSNFDIGDLGNADDYDDWSDHQNHKGFDVAATRIFRALGDYVEKYVDDCETTYWLTGHSRGAAIANIVSAKLIDLDEEVFAYTFATPNTTVKETADAPCYDSIFNVVNENDFVTYMPMSQWGFVRYGKSAEGCRIAGATEKEWEKFTGKGNYDSIAQDALTDLVAELANCSDEGWSTCHTYTCECHSDMNDNSIVEKGVEPGVYKNDIKGKRADKYCKATEYSRAGVQKQYKLCQTPAYFMQVLAELMVEQGTWGFEGKVEQLVEVVGIYSVADRYEHARNLVVVACIRGIKHQHYTESYYIITRHLSSTNFS